MTEDELRAIEEMAGTACPFARSNVPAIVAALREERAAYDALEENRDIVEAENAQLRAEVERLRAEEAVEHWMDRLNRADIELADMYERNMSLRSENAQLRAEVERLRAAADGPDREATS